MKTPLYIAVYIAICVANTHAFFISGYGPSSWNPDVETMDANLGIDETFIIEDFEDPEFVPGLSWSKINGDPSVTQPTLVPESTFPGNWDGVQSLRAEHDFIDGDAVFTYSEQLSMFGISISDMTPSCILSIYVDENLVGTTDTLSEFASDLINQHKNGYLWIAAEEDESFNEVSLICDRTDRFYYDHCALKTAKAAVPEPGITPLLGMGIFGLLLLGKRKAIAYQISTSSLTIKNRYSGRQKHVCHFR